MVVGFFEAESFCAFMELGCVFFFLFFLLLLSLAFDHLATNNGF